MWLSRVFFFLFNWKSCDPYIFNFQITAFEVWSFFFQIRYVIFCLKKALLPSKVPFDVWLIPAHRDVWGYRQMLPWARPLPAHHPGLYGELWSVQPQPLHRLTLWVWPKVSVRTHPPGIFNTEAGFQAFIASRETPATSNSLSTPWHLHILPWLAWKVR